MNWLHYLLEANIYLAVFYAGYCLFLNKETYYTLNRVYLLLSCIISFILPAIQIGALKSTEEQAAKTYTTVVQNVHTAIAPTPVNYQPEVSHFSFQDAIWYGYLIGIAILTLILIIKIYKLIKMTAGAKTTIGNKYKLIGIDRSNTAFSFFNYLFIGKNTAGNDTIIRHELVHIRQKHSVDILFLELIRIINWFNPIIYLMQISLKTVHEYIADEQTAALENNTLAYSAFLVNNAYGLNGSSITHSFFNYNLLKKRIIMLNQKRSGNLARLKYLVALPICAGMLCASTLAFSKNYVLVDLAPKANRQLLTAKALGIVPKAKSQKNNMHLQIGMADYKTNKKTTNIPAAPTLINDVTKLPPPPLPAPPAVNIKPAVAKPAPPDFAAFYKYIAKSVRYPAIDYEKHIGGRVIATFDIIDGKIIDPKIVRGVEPVMDGELLRVLKAYDGSLDLTAGHYSMPVSFQLIDSKNNQVAHLPKNYTNDNQKSPADKPIKQSTEFSTSLSLDEVVVVGYIND
jgi:hypothetical protein